MEQVEKWADGEVIPETYQRLRTQVVMRMWPTPKGSPEHYGQPRENDRGDLQAAVLMFPTPTAGEHTQNQSASPNAAVRPTLVGMARYGLWPTPDTQAQQGGEAGRIKHCLEGKGGWDISAAVYYQAMQEKGLSKEQVASGGQLNPTWVEWLMGLPIGWTALEPVATESYRRWRQSFCGEPGS
jgi:hypothetical protein